MLAAITAATGYALYDAYSQSAKSTLKGILKKGGAPAAADEAVGWAAFSSNVIYITAFVTLALYVMPNFTGLIPALATTSKAVDAAISMLLPAGVLFAHGRKLF